MVEHPAELDHDTMRLLEAGDCGTLAIDVATGRQLLAEQIGKATGEINALLAERGRLRTINTELVEALERIAQLQRDKCENAGAEMLFILLDNKVDIARAALAKAKPEKADA